MYVQGGLEKDNGRLYPDKRVLFGGVMVQTDEAEKSSFENILNGPSKFDIAFNTFNEPLTPPALRTISFTIEGWSKELEVNIYGVIHAPCLREIEYGSFIILCASGAPENRMEVVLLYSPKSRKGKLLRNRIMRSGRSSDYMNLVYDSIR